MVMFREISQHRFEYIDGHNSKVTYDNKDKGNAYCLTDCRGLLIAFQEFDKALNKIRFFERIIQ